MIHLPAEIEDEFRLWAFHVHYQRTCSEIVDATVRFAAALRLSCRPILDVDAVLEWHRQRHDGGDGGPCDDENQTCKEQKI